MELKVERESFRGIRIVEYRRVSTTKRRDFESRFRAHGDASLVLVVPVLHVGIDIDGRPPDGFQTVMKNTDIDTLEKDLAERIAAAADETALEAERVAALGRKGKISELLKGLGAMTPEERQVMGPALNGLKERIGQAILSRRAILREAELARRLDNERVDVTLPVRAPPLSTGRIHPVSQVTDEITAIFADLGFAIAEGPDVETDYYNFTALNFPVGHPARDMHDTLFLIKFGLG